jgi:SSS family solute:Na+ symporter
VLYSLPTGVRAVLFAALLAAAMSSLDSALNSISAVTMRDFVEKKWDLDLKQKVRTSRIVTIVWGAIITGLAFFADSISDTIIEAVNKVGSAFYGPILAAFLLGIFYPRSNSKGVIVGVLSGVLFNMVLWIAEVDIYWMWWNMIGFLSTVVVAALVSRFTFDEVEYEKGREFSAVAMSDFNSGPLWKPSYTILVLYFLLILGTAAACTFYAAS